MVITGFPCHLISATVRTAKIVLFSKEDEATDRRERLMSEIFSLARIFRTGGPKALEKAAREAADHPFLARGVSLVAEGYDRWSLLSVLEHQRNREMAKRKGEIGLISTLMRLSPTLGMAGTVVSLMQVMYQLDSGMKMGPSICLALSSTLYGIILANLFLMPLATRMEEHFRKKTIEENMIIEAVMGIGENLHPIRIAERLNACDFYFQQIHNQKKLQEELRESSSPDIPGFASSRTIPDASGNRS